MLLKGTLVGYLYLCSSLMSVVSDVVGKSHRASGSKWGIFTANVPKVRDTTLTTNSR